MPKSKFEQTFSWAQSSGAMESIYFAGATQRGRSWNHENNQDALAIASGKSFLAAVISDGCSTAPTGYSSSNEVGAKLISRLVCQYCNDLLQTESVSKFEENFASHSNAIVEQVRSMVQACAGGFEHNTFVQCYWTATVLGLIMDSKRFLIFGYGDGIFAVDSQLTNLEQNSGNYMSHDLFENSSTNRCSSNFQIYSAGKTDEFTTILIASDGIEDIANEHSAALLNFLTAASAPRSKSTSFGYDASLIGTFRKSITFRPDYVEWEGRQDNYDDRTFFVVSNLIERAGLPKIELDALSEHANFLVPMRDPRGRIKTSTSPFEEPPQMNKITTYEETAPVINIVPSTPHLDEFRRNFVDSHDGMNTIQVPQRSRLSDEEDNYRPSTVQPTRVSSIQQTKPCPKSGKKLRLALGRRQKKRIPRRLKHKLHKTKFPFHCNQGVVTKRTRLQKVSNYKRRGSNLATKWNKRSRFMQFAQAVDFRNGRRSKC